MFSQLRLFVFLNSTSVGKLPALIVKAHFSFAFSGLKHHLLESSVGYLNSNCTLPIFTKTGFY